ncbi:hypothetical protein AK830_g11587 [Neonectria ditissima]|uniref:Uncharacterized protein n=1 Tax=Neonectria ditissima TaxID=78410 RepID=A0A0P7B109_9HYPO|nr:hypothetical protein AK830_g11587 [Neonectria ditissima]
MTLAVRGERDDVVEVQLFLGSRHPGSIPTFHHAACRYLCHILAQSKDLTNRLTGIGGQRYTTVTAVNVTNPRPCMSILHPPDSARRPSPRAEDSKMARDGGMRQPATLTNKNTALVIIINWAMTGPTSHRPPNTSDAHFRPVRNGCLSPSAGDGDA